MKNTIICDIDGTIADATHRLHYIKPALSSSDDPTKFSKNWDEFFAATHADSVFEDMRDILWSLLAGRLQRPRSLVYVSGRSEVCRQATESWLERHNFPRAQVFMRAEGDFRPDYVVKEEILDRDLKLLPKDVFCVLEDRNQVVNMWRRRGFRVLQVADGAY